MAEDKDQDALAAEWAAQLEAEEAAQPEAVAKSDNTSSDDDLAAKWAAALAEDEQTGIKKEKEQAAFASKAKSATFADFTEESKAPRSETGVRKDLDFILDIPLDISAELGRTRLLINELLQLGQGSVVELNKLAGEPLEVYVNGKIIARGEAVVINEKFGIRLTDIISPIERVKQLG